MTNARDNDTWLKDLRAGSAQRDAALADLHTLLLRVLPQEYPDGSVLLFIARRCRTYWLIPTQLFLAILPV